MTYKEIALAEGISVPIIKRRIGKVVHAFGAKSVTNLVAILIASDVLRLQDLYQELSVQVREYKRDGTRGSVRPLTAMRI